MTAKPAPYIPGLHQAPVTDEPRVFFAERFLNEIRQGLRPSWSINSRIVTFTPNDEVVRIWRLTGRTYDRCGMLKGGDVGHEAIWPD